MTNHAIAHSLVWYPYYPCIYSFCMGYNLVSSNTTIIFNYQLQIPLHFGSTVKTESCEYHSNLLTLGVSFVYRNQPSTILTYWIFDKQLLGLSFCTYIYTFTVLLFPTFILSRYFRLVLYCTNCALL